MSAPASREGKRGRAERSRGRLARRLLQQRRQQRQQQPLAAAARCLRTAPQRPELFPKDTTIPLYAKPQSEHSLTRDTQWVSGSDNQHRTVTA